jgi:hypothetical protein
MHRNNKDAGRFRPEHFRGVIINGNSPPFRKKPPPFPVNISSRRKKEVPVCCNGSGVCAGFFPQAIVFQKARNAPKADYGGFDFIHDPALPRPISCHAGN